MSFDKVSIEFCGLANDFRNKCHLKLEYTDPSTVKKLNLLKNNSTRDYFTSHRPVLFEIDIYYFNSKTKEKLKLVLVSNMDNEIILQSGYYSQFKNGALFNYIASIIKLEAIKNYNGSLSQEEYDKLIDIP